MYFRSLRCKYALRFFFFFFLFILYSYATYVDHDEAHMRALMYSLLPRCSPRLAARCKLPSALRPGLTCESMKAHQ